MSDGVMLSPGGGRRIVGGGLDATVKVTTSHPALMSTFEMIIPAGYDVGAHVHAHGEEVFYVIDGELDVLAFEPVDRSLPDWYHWESRSGQRYLHGGPGAFMFVPENVPHAFANRTTKPTRIFFQSSVPGGHENYFDELLALLRQQRHARSEGHRRPAAPLRHRAAHRAAPRPAPAAPSGPPPRRGMRPDRAQDSPQQGIQSIEVGSRVLLALEQGADRWRSRRSPSAAACTRARCTAIS